ncbi:MAG TPA: pyridoxal phosphate-dependent aminotransferase [Myxococcales bacterium]|jgi:aspartate aminotransferase
MPQNVLDRIPLGGIVSVRDRLLDLQAKGRKVYRLESGDPSFPIPSHVKAAMERALEAGHTHYTAGAGIKPLREALLRKLVEENRIPVHGAERVFVTNGAMHALYVTFRALLEPGDEVIVPSPTWTETFDNVSLSGGVPVHVPLDEAHGYRWEPEAIEAAVNKRTKALVINTPHNPTGAVLSRENLQGIVKVAERHGLWVVSDEAYEHVLFDKLHHVSAGALGYPKVVSVFSMSKSYAMSGLRVGYLACNDDHLAERYAKLLRCTINGVNSVAQHGALAASTGPQDETRAMCAEYQRRRDALWESLSGVSLLKPFKPSGAFYLWARIGEGWKGGKSGWDMTDYLLERGVGSAPGEVFGPAGAGHVRFAFSCSTEQVVAGAAVLKEALSG